MRSNLGEIEFAWNYRLFLRCTFWSHIWPLTFWGNKSMGSSSRKMTRLKLEPSFSLIARAKFIDNTRFMPMYDAQAERHMKWTLSEFFRSVLSWPSKPTLASAGGVSWSITSSWTLGRELLPYAESGVMFGTSTNKVASDSFRLNRWFLWLFEQQGGGQNVAYVMPRIYIREASRVAVSKIAVSNKFLVRTHEKCDQHASNLKQACPSIFQYIPAQTRPHDPNL
jgi:hypothetical protein